jgi:hypothetical protein
MDDDVKTLLAILALVYGSSNGIGLLKEALDPVKENTKELKEQISNPAADTSFRKTLAKGLLKSLWLPRVIVYLLIVVIVPVFLFFVARDGPLSALAWIGLASTPTQPASPRPLTFYWILFALSLVATGHYLSAYLGGWLALLKYLRHKDPETAG